MVLVSELSHIEPFRMQILLQGDFCNVMGIASFFCQLVLWNAIAFKKCGTP